MRVEIFGPENEYSSKVEIDNQVIYKTLEINKGLRGRSAYEVAKRNGFKGDEQEWLRSLTAYGVALSNGFVGTEEEWLESLKYKFDITPEKQDMILTNDGSDPYWISLEESLNTQEIIWDLGNF